MLVIGLKGSTPHSHLLTQPLTSILVLTGGNLADFCFIPQFAETLALKDDQTARNSKTVSIKYLQSLCKLSICSIVISDAVNSS